MNSNRNDISNWRKHAFRKREEPRVVSIPQNQSAAFARSDRCHFNMLVLVLIAFIGFVSFPLITYSRLISPYNDFKPVLTKSYETNDGKLTPDEYAQLENILTRKLISRLTKIPFTK